MRHDNIRVAAPSQASIYPGGKLYFTVLRMKDRFDRFDKNDADYFRVGWRHHFDILSH